MMEEPVIQVKKAKLEDSPVSQNPLNKFSLTLLSYILRFLEFKDQIAFLLVSNKFRQALFYQFSINNDLDLTLYRKVDPRGLAFLYPLHKSLRSLSVSYEYLEANMGLCKAVNSSECKLRALTLYKVDVSRCKYNFLAFCEYFSNSLTEFSVSFITTKKSVVPLEDIMNVYPNLRVFKYFIDGLDSEGDWFSCIKIDFRKVNSTLEWLELTNMDSAYLHTIPASVNRLHLHYNELASAKAYPSAEQLKTLVRRSPVWKGFGFHAKHSTSHPAIPIDPELVTLLAHYQSLKSLGLSVHCKNRGCENKSVNDMNLMGVAAGKNSLETLKLNSFKSVTEASIISFACCCGGLQEISLDYSAINDDAIDSISANLGETLKILSIKGCNLVAEECLEGLFKACKKLEKIDLTCVHRVTNCTLFAVFLHGKALRSITLVQNDIDNLGLRSLFQTTSLREIKISEAPIDDYGLILASIGLEKYQGYPVETSTDLLYAKAFEEHVQLCQFLQNHNPTLGPMYTEEHYQKALEIVLNEFKENCKLKLRWTNVPFLHTLYLNETHITNYGIGFVMQECKRLFKVSVNRCNVSIKVLAKLLKTCVNGLGYCSATNVPMSEDKKADLIEICRKRFIKLTL